MIAKPSKWTLPITILLILIVILLGWIFGDHSSEDKQPQPPKSQQPVSQL